MLRFLSKYLPRHTLNEIYKLYVQPHLDYGDVIYHIPHKTCEFSHSFKLTNQMEKLEAVHARTERFKSTFYPNCLSEWEKLDPEIRESRSVNVFKKQLLGLIHPPSKSVYGIHDPKLLSVLTQLCVGLSKLNYHKFKHNFRDTFNPLCLINDGIEDTEHFLLLCSAYDIHRRDLLDSVNTILRPHGLSNPPNKELLQILLYGHEKLPFDSNTNILDARIKFIQASERFQ